MRLKSLCFSVIIYIACIASAQTPVPHTFGISAGDFFLDGKSFQIISGEIHYPRVPRAYWRARFRMARAMGLNTITTYVFWNAHEPRPGIYDFSGDNDVAEFVREAQQEGLWVILRPGPYVCAEWDFGGYPAWLLKDPATVVRSRDPKFMEPARRWLKRLGQELAPLQVGNGGPIILTQVENEYGSFDSDHEYMEQIHRALVDAGFTKSTFYTADGPNETPAGSLPGMAVGINFGAWNDPNSARTNFEALKKIRPEGPYMNSEYWVGWFDHWGDKHAATNTAAQVANLDWTLHQGYSVSLYMFHGGTSFGWMNGANSDGKNYEPDVTSYDYDSPLDESGRPTAKYYAFRDVIARATGVRPPAVPASEPTIAIPEFKLTASASLWQNLPKPVRSEKPLTMEDLDQAYGYILYRAALKEAGAGELLLDELHDYAKIYLDGKPVGTLDRRLGQNHLPLEVRSAGARLDILVENTGRVNFSKVLLGERKGITHQVTWAGKPVTGWEIFTLPMTQTPGLPFAAKPCEGACFYRGEFEVAAPADTFLDTSNFTKGQVWLNGRALGRVWNIGPQKTLYVPQSWLQKGRNEVIVFDLEGQSGRTLAGRDKPMLDSPAAAK